MASNVEEDPLAANPSCDTVEDDDQESADGVLLPSFPTGRVKRIMRLDRDIRKVNSEALFLISLSSQIFLESLAERARTAAARKRRRIIKLEHLRAAVRGHSPTADFLLDCLPEPLKQPHPRATSSNQLEKPMPAGARRIDEFFPKT